MRRGVQLWRLGCFDAPTCTIRMFLYSSRYSMSLLTYFSLRSRRDAPASAIAMWDEQRGERRKQKASGWKLGD